MESSQIRTGYRKLDDKGRLVLSKKHLQFLKVAPGGYVKLYELEKERAIAIEAAEQGVRT